MKKSKFTLAAAVTALVLMFFAVRSCSSDSPEEIKEQQSFNRELAARTVARKSVEEKVNPFVPDFNSLDTTTKKLNDSVYIVSGSFDYENAKLKANYQCLVLMKTDSTGVCNSLKIE